MKKNIFKIVCGLMILSVCIICIISNTNNPLEEENNTIKNIPSLKYELKTNN